MQYYNAIRATRIWTVNQLLKLVQRTAVMVRLLHTTTLHNVDHSGLVIVVVVGLLVATALIFIHTVL